MNLLWHLLARDESNQMAESEVRGKRHKTLQVYVPVVRGGIMKRCNLQTKSTLVIDGQGEQNFKVWNICKCNWKMKNLNHTRWPFWYIWTGESA